MDFGSHTEHYSYILITKINNHTSYHPKWEIQHETTEFVVPFTD